MIRRQRSLTLGQLIQVVSQYSRNDHEVGLVVADLLQRGVVIRARPAAVNAALQAMGRVRKL
jgi:hypothetical protein